MPPAEQRIYTLRHAAIDFGRDHIIAGRLDPPLSRKGIAQIAAMRTAGPSLEYDLVISSPLQRAFDTACRFTGMDADDIVTSELCVERDYGRLQGVPESELGQIRPRTYYVTAGGVRHSLNPPDGETLEQLRERVIAFHEFLASQGFGSVLVVSHAAFLQQYQGFLRGLDVYHALEDSVSYVELTAFELRNRQLVSHSVLYRPKAIEEPW